MSGHDAPIEIDGPDHPHAFDGIPVERRPDFPCTPCPRCRGHGAWNERLWSGGRCVIRDCPDCDGSGWIACDGARHVQDIVMVDGHPAWVMTITPRAPSGDPAP